MVNTTTKAMIKPPFNSTGGTLPDGTAYSSWDQALNYNFDLLDSTLGNSSTISVTGVGANQTFTLAQYRNMTINFTGTIVTNLVYTMPTIESGFWYVKNSTTGAFNLYFGYNGFQTILPQGHASLILIDPNNSPYISSIPIEGVLTISGDPNGIVAGSASPIANVVYDTVNKKLWICTTTGPASGTSAAVWKAVATLASNNVWTGTNDFNNNVSFNDIPEAPASGSTAATPAVPTFSTFNNSAIFNRSVSYKPQTLVVTSSAAAWDMSLGPDAILNVSANIGINLPTKIPDNGRGFLLIKNSNTTFVNISWNAIFANIYGGQLTPILLPGNNYFEYWVSGGIIYIDTRSDMTLKQTQNASNTAFMDFWVPTTTKEITVTLDSLVSNGSNWFILQLGSGTVASPVIDNVGYDSAWMRSNGGGNAVINDSHGYVMEVGIPSRTATIELTMPTINKWVAKMLGHDGGSIYSGYGIKSVSQSLSIIRITTINGSTTPGGNLFTAGSITVISK